MKDLLSLGIVNTQISFIYKVVLLNGSDRLGLLKGDGSVFLEN